jgi:hypothetical protein
MLTRAPTVLYDPDYPPISKGEKRKRQKEKQLLTGCRGKDRGKRRARTPILFNFFESIHALEAREIKADDSRADPSSEKLKAEFAALSKPAPFQSGFCAFSSKRPRKPGFLGSAGAFVASAAALASAAARFSFSASHFSKLMPAFAARLAS